jgi:hypothetical protein
MGLRNTLRRRPSAKRKKVAPPWWKPFAEFAAVLSAVVQFAKFLQWLIELLHPL